MQLSTSPNPLETVWYFFLFEMGLGFTVVFCSFAKKKPSRTTSSETWTPGQWWVGKTWGVEAREPVDGGDVVLGVAPGYLGKMNPPILTIYYFFNWVGWNHQLVFVLMIFPRWRLILEVDGLKTHGRCFGCCFFVVNWLLDVVLPFLRFNSCIAKKQGPMLLQKTTIF